MKAMMKRMMVAAMAMVMATAAMAQGRGHYMAGGGYNGGHNRMEAHHPGGGHNMGGQGYHMDMHHGRGGHMDMHHHSAPAHHHMDMHPMPAPHPIHPRYANCVRYMDNGRWGYYRDGAWLYYDTYYEPEYYFAHPVGHFHSHRILDKVVTTAVATAAVIDMIHVLSH